MRSLLLIFMTLIVTSCVGSSVQDKALLTGHWEGELMHDGKSWKVNLDVWDENGKLTGTVDAVDQGRYGIAISDLKLSGKRLEFAVDVGAENRTKANLAESEMLGTFAGLGIKAEFSAKKMSDLPVRVREDNVSIQSEGATLAATLLVPEGSGPFPAVVFGHGSGQWLRSMSSYRSRAVYLARNGIAALIYDRRGQGESTGESDRILPISTLALDMESAAEYLATRPDIDSKSIGVYGLSQSGWSAPLAATQSDKVAYVITVSAAGVTPDEQNEFVIDNRYDRYVARSLGSANIRNDVVKEIIENNRQVRKEMIQEVAAVDTMELVPGVSHFDPVPVWRQVKVPVLCLWGEADDIVPAEKSRMLIEQALIDGGNSRFTMKTYSDATHTLQLVRNPNQSWDWDRQAPGVDEMIVSWVKQQAGR